MAAVEITCPHCNRIQKVAEYRLKETVYCLLCQQLITDVYMYKVAPKQQELTIKLKGRIVSEFGTTKLDELKSKSDDYTRRFEPVEEDASEDAQEDTNRLFESGSFHALPERRKRLSTAAKTYLIGGIAMAALTVVVVVIGVTVLTGGSASKGEIDTAGADGVRIERWGNGTKKSEWHVLKVGGEELLDGLWEEWHEDGSKATVGQYSAGEKVGMWRTWHSNGQMASECEYRSGKPVGTCSEWHRNGSKALLGEYKDGKKDGEWRGWFSNGAFALTERYDNGTPIGDWNTWYEDGKSQSHGQYIQGLRDGRWVNYHDNGVESRSENWKDGILDGEVTESYRTRKQSMQGYWQEGKRTGTWTWWHNNSEKAKEGAFADGLESGEWLEWHATGVLKLQGTYEAGKRIGQWREFDEDGNLAVIREYLEGTLTSEKHYFRGIEVQRRTSAFEDGALKSEWSVLLDTEGGEVRHGYQRGYYPSGSLAEIGTFVKGEKDGAWRSFDEAGHVIIEETYENGTKVIR